MLKLFRKPERVATLLPQGTTLPVKGGQRLLDAALAQGLNWPHDCRVGSCGTCRCLLREGEIKSLTDLAYTLGIEDIRAGAVLACQALLKSDVVVEIELDQQAAEVETVEGRIASLTPLTHDIVEVAISLPRPAFRGARAGQYLEVTAAGLEAPRSYSFARDPVHADQVSFVIRHVPGGLFTDWLFSGDRRGETLSLRGPRGSFGRGTGGGRIVCVAGGSGIAPVHAILEAALREEISRPCIILFGVRTQADIFFRQELERIQQQWRASFEIIPVLSEEPAQSVWAGARGTVVTDMKRLIGPPAPGDEAYLCGPPAMVDAALTELAQLGFRPDMIFFDKFLDASTYPDGRRMPGAERLPRPLP